MTTRRNWQREELLLALNLYCRLPFGQYHSHNPEILKLAKFVERTPSAVAMKLSNFASFDPYHQSRGIKGLQNASQADQDIWDEFSVNWAELAVESEIAYARLSDEEIPELETSSSEPDTVSMQFFGLTETKRIVKIRLGQQFFRKVIMTSYANKCCVCGMPIPEMLIASHIIPWRNDEALRVNPHNGLCLCALHDKGFDRGFFTIAEDYKVVIGKAIHYYLPNASVNSGFKIYEGQMISLPDKFIPKQEFLHFIEKIVFLVDTESFFCTECDQLNTLLRNLPLNTIHKVTAFITRQSHSSSSPTRMQETNCRLELSNAGQVKVQCFAPI